MDNEHPTDPSLPVVRLHRVQFGWPSAGTLLAIDEFIVGPGERVFLEGPSGSGKSTLLGLISGIQLPDAGRVELLGQDTHALSAGQRDRLRGAAIGFVFQQFNLVPYLSVVDNVLLPLGFSPARRGRCGGLAGGRRQAVTLLERLGLGSLEMHKLPAALSVGQQQRVAVARALLGGPRLVICDEPTSALDADARDGFLELLLEVCAANAAAILFVSHDHALAGRFDRVQSMSDFAPDAPA